MSKRQLYDRLRPAGPLPVAKGSTWGFRSYFPLALLSGGLSRGMEFKQLQKSLPSKGYLFNADR